MKRCTIYSLQNQCIEQEKNILWVLKRNWIGRKHAPLDSIRCTNKFKNFAVLRPDLNANSLVRAHSEWANGNRHAILEWLWNMFTKIIFRHSEKSGNELLVGRCYCYSWCIWGGRFWVLVVESGFVCSDVGIAMPFVAIRPGSFPFRPFSSPVQCCPSVRITANMFHRKLAACGDAYSFFGHWLSTFLSKARNLRLLRAELNGVGAIQWRKKLMFSCRIFLLL